MDNNLTEADYIFFPSIIANSSHRDGAIYKNKLLKENWYDIDINDHTESMYPNDHFCCRIFHILEMSIFAQFYIGEPVDSTRDTSSLFHN